MSASQARPTSASLVGTTEWTFVHVAKAGIQHSRVGMYACWMHGTQVDKGGTAAARPASGGGSCSDEQSGFKWCIYYKRPSKVLLCCVSELCCGLAVYCFVECLQMEIPQARNGWSGGLVNLIPSTTGTSLFTAKTGASGSKY
jgi:hypothetical protein